MSYLQDRLDKTDVALADERRKVARLEGEVAELTTRLEAVEAVIEVLRASNQAASTEPLQ